MNDTTNRDNAIAELERLGAALADARAAERNALADVARLAIVAASVGASESEIARRAGVNRNTIRAMLGK